MNRGAADRWADAGVAAALLAIDPHGLGGAALRACAGPVRDRWLAGFRALLPPAGPFRRLPLHAGDERLLGGLDLAATLSAGRPVAQRGVLAEADGGVVLAAMAERIERGAAARLAAAQDAGEVMLERDGLAQRLPARFGLILLDEGVNDEERPPAALLDRLAFRIDLAPIGLRDAREPGEMAGGVAAARGRYALLAVDAEIIEALCAAATQLGVASLRSTLLAVRAARAAAALHGAARVLPEHAAIAARLVLAPLATRLPDSEPQSRQQPSPRQNRGGENLHEEDRVSGGPLEDRVLAAAQAAIPDALLKQLLDAESRGTPAAAAGGAGAQVHHARRGRPAGVRRGSPRPGARLNVIETLRAAAPWQRLRRAAGGRGTSALILVRSEDFRVTRYKQRAPSTTIFAVDASGSSAMNRLAEAKGAVELLLAECYVRRDRVALLAFRGRGAEVLLPPTRSLVRAKRSLAALPGGGGTPLAAGIIAALALADSVRRAGEQPCVVLFTDGRANVGLDGSGSRAKAGEDALAAGRRLRAAGVAAMILDTSPRPDPQARAIADSMNARYIPLPYAGAAAVVGAVRAGATGGP
jgi:magnesium chelatase subunit D